MRSLLFHILLFLSIQATAQGYWFTTRDFPGGPKTSIAGLQDSILLVSTANGIWRSENEGYSWNHSLRSTPVFNLFVTSQGTIVGTGRGKLFLSVDKGLSWDSTSVSTTFPIVKIIENNAHRFFLITQDFTSEEGFVGDGVFYSSGDLRTWTKRNDGLPAHLRHVENIAVDKNKRLYITLADENASGQGGLYISNNDGLLWTHVTLSVPNLGTVRALQSQAVNVTPSDSVIVSVTGSAVNISATVNLVKHINDITASTTWRPMRVRTTGNWWEDLTLNDIHFSRNGDWYSSATNSLTLGGVFYSKDQGKTWTKKVTGLGMSISQRREKHLYFESSYGRIYSVQQLDERVYWNNESIVEPMLISGRIKDSNGKKIPGAEITIGHFIKYPDADGTFSFVVHKGWTGKLQPAAPNYTFNPTFASLTNLQQSVALNDFVGSYMGNYFLSGHVLDRNGEPASNVKIEGLPAPVFTNENGFFLIELPARWTGELKAVAKGFDFEPSIIKINSLTSDLSSQNFVIRRSGIVFLSGSVKGEDGKPFFDASFTGLPDAPRLNDKGEFIIELPVGWSGVIELAAPNHTLSPNKLAITNLGSDLLNQRFIATAAQPKRVMVSGYVKDNAGAGIANLKIEGFPSELFTDSEGHYSIELPAGWSGTIRLTLENYSFDPASIDIQNIQAPISNQNFRASLITGLPDDPAEKITVFPNPAPNREFYIQGDVSQMITILDATGIKVWSALLQDLTDNRFKAPGPGLYVVVGSRGRANRVVVQ